MGYSNPKIRVEKDVLRKGKIKETLFIFRTAVPMTDFSDEAHNEGRL